MSHSFIFGGLATLLALKGGKKMNILLRAGEIICLVGCLMFTIASGVLLYENIKMRKIADEKRKKNSNIALAIGLLGLSIAITADMLWKIF